MLGISKDSVESHKNFIAKHKLTNITLLADTEKKVIKTYGTKHWLLPISRRVYIIVDKNRKIVFKKDTGFALLENQTETLIKKIDTFLQ